MTFTATNGATVTKLKHDGTILISGNPGGSGGDPRRCNSLWPGNDVALAEYFQAERDKKLGLWRWPENPEYVVKQPNPYELAVIHEPTFWKKDIIQFTNAESLAEFVNQMPSSNTKPWRKAARAYLKANPITQPWHDAKPGEVWLVKTAEFIDGTPMLVEARLDRANVFNNETHTYSVKLPDIYDARRIWPEQENS